MIHCLQQRRGSSRGLQFFEGSRKMTRMWSCLMIVMAAGAMSVLAQTPAPPAQNYLAAGGGNTTMQTTDDWNRRLQELVHSALSKNQNGPSPGDYRIGPNDLLKITVIDAPDLSHPARVGEDGEVSMPMLGTIKAAGLTTRELELVLEALLRRTYMKDPHVVVSVTEMQSHSVSVLGAVKKPGVFQIRGTKTLLEMLSMAEGLSPDAGDAVVVMRGASSDFDPGLVSKPEAAGSARVSAMAETQAKPKPVLLSSENDENGHAIVISLKRLLDSGDPRYNVPIYPGDIVKVKAAGIVYVVGDVKQPGGFPVKDNEHITVLQAIALGQGIGPDAAKNKASIIRVAENGQQIQLPINLGKILSGKSPDIPLQPKDILFVPKSGAKSTGRAALDTFTKMIIWRGIP